MYTYIRRAIVLTFPDVICQLIVHPYAYYMCIFGCDSIVNCAYKLLCLCLASIILLTWKKNSNKSIRLQILHRTQPQTNKLHIFCDNDCLPCINDLEFVVINLREHYIRICMNLSIHIDANPEWFQYCRFEGIKKNRLT